MKKTIPLVSVVMPVYNCSQYIDEAIESMVKQTYTNIEIFIIDDCSTDGTKEKLETWAKLDERIRPIYKLVNSGYVDSLNLAIGLSNGAYIARMDGDDISLPDRIAKQVLFMETHEEIGLIGSGHRILDTDEIFEPIEDDRYIKIGLLLANQFSHPTAFFRRNSIRNLGRFYLSKFIPAEDYEYWNFLSDKIVMGNIQEVLLIYRSHSEGISKKLPNDLNTLEVIKSSLKRLKDNPHDDSILFIRSLNGNNSKFKLANCLEGIDFNTVFEELQNFVRINRKLGIYDKKLFSRFVNLLLVVLCENYGWKKSYFRSRDVGLKIEVLFKYLNYLILPKSKNLESYFIDFIPKRF
jgi:glycosyltransferase involved in cell wall biosynthesis